MRVLHTGDTAEVLMRQLIWMTSTFLLGLCVACPATPLNQIESASRDDGETTTEGAMNIRSGGMVHLSLMGPLEAEHEIERLPEWLVGDWEISGATGEEQGLLFRLRPDPAECRVLRRMDNGWIEVGSMPYSYFVDGRVSLMCTGRFHLSYSLDRLSRDGDDGLIGHFSHRGSGLIYADHGVRLERIEIDEDSVVEDEELVR
jgi:hypothetical protein